MDNVISTEASQQYRDLQKNGHVISTEASLQHRDLKKVDTVISTEASLQHRGCAKNVYRHLDRSIAAASRCAVERPPHFALLATA